MSYVKVLEPSSGKIFYFNAQLNPPAPSKLELKPEPISVPSNTLTSSKLSIDSYPCHTPFFLKDIFADLRSHEWKLLFDNKPSMDVSQSSRPKNVELTQKLGKEDVLNNTYASKLKLTKAQKLKRKASAA